MALYDLDNRIRAFGESRRLNVGTAKNPRWITNVHAGDDYAETYGQDRVLAVCSGKVIHVGLSSTYGNQVHVRVSSSLVVRYHSLAGKSALRVGDTVTVGQTFIGFTGKSASGASGNHVHIQAEVNGKPVDPRPYISGAAAGGSSRPFDNTEDDMYSDADRLRDQAVFDAVFNTAPSLPDNGRSIGSSLAGIVTVVDQIKSTVTQRVERGRDASGNPILVSQIQELADAKTIAIRLEAQLSALNAAVSALAVANGVDPEKLSAMIASKVDAALADNFAAIPDAVRTNIKGAL